MTKTAKRASREEIIKVLTKFSGGTMTYHIANCVGFCGNAAPVRRELERMMREGLVERAPDNIYARQIKWRLTRAQAQQKGPAS